MTELFMAGDQHTATKLNQICEKGQSYIIRKNGANYEALNGGTAVIESTNTNASTVIQYAIDSLAGTGGTIHIKKGTYYIPTTIQLATGVRFEGEAWISTVLTWTGAAGGTVIEGKDVVDVTVTKIYVHCMGLANVGLKIWGNSFQIYNINLAEFTIDGALQYPIWLQNINLVTASTVTTALHTSGHAAGASAIYLSQVIDSQFFGCMCSGDYPLMYAWKISYCTCTRIFGGESGGQLYIEYSYLTGLYTVDIEAYYVYSTVVVISSEATGFFNTEFRGAFINDSARGITLDTVKGVTVEGCWFNGMRVDGVTTQTFTYDVYSTNLCTAVTVIGNKLDAGSVIKSATVGSSYFIRNNDGYKTEAASGAEGTGSLQTIPHGLAAQPNHVSVVPTQAGATVTWYADATNLYITCTNGIWYVWSAQIV